MLDLAAIKKYLKTYDGETATLMEVCGTHTAEISHSGILSMLSPKINLVSGPGCPVCVTVAGYIDQLVQISETPGHCVAVFGDMLRVRGTEDSLQDARGRGGNVLMLYSPFDLLQVAQDHPEIQYVFAAVGFETTAPVYAVLIQKIISMKLRNLRILTALKTMPPAIEWICSHQSPSPAHRKITGFIAPGNVSVITGPDVYQPFADRYHLPFAVAGFEPDLLLTAIYALVRHQNEPKVMNLYPQAVEHHGNEKARQLVSQYFSPADAAWRGIGMIPGSGLVLRSEFASLDAGSTNLGFDHNANPQCQCPQVLTGMIKPTQCPLFGSSCTPGTPQGACMVSTEGSCYHWILNRRT